MPVQARAIHVIWPPTGCLAAEKTEHPAQAVRHLSNAEADKETEFYRGYFEAVASDAELSRRRTGDFEGASMKSKLIYAAWGLALVSTGCLHPKIGPNSLHRDRAAYSSGIAESRKAQMLLNVIKLRYIDAPTFVDVGNIVVSYTLSQNASFGAEANQPTGATKQTLGVHGEFINHAAIGV
jgi:hypothetical protein